MATIPDDHIIAKTKNLDDVERAALFRFESHTGFEPMNLDDINDGTMTFDEAWDANVEWLQHLVDEVRRMKPARRGARRRSGGRR